MDNDPWVTDLSKARRIERTGSDDEDTPVTVVELFKENVDLDAMASTSRIALSIDREQKTLTWTYQQYYTAAVRLAAGLVKLGMDARQSMCIMSSNNPEWAIAYHAILCAHCVPTGIYSTCTTANVLDAADVCEPVCFFVEDDVQLQKLLSIRSSIPTLKMIVQMTGDLCGAWEGVYTFATLQDSGDIHSAETLKRRMASSVAEECAVLLFTSGTEDKPKAVMLSHDNLTFTAKRLIKEGLVLPPPAPQDRLVSFLPLAHIAGQLIDVICASSVRAHVHFTQRESLLPTLQRIRPTVFVGVPRLWDKVMQSIQYRLQSTWKVAVDAAMNIGYAGTLSKRNGTWKPFGWYLSNALVFKKIKRRLGLDQARLLATTSAPLSQQTHAFFMSIDCPLYDFYGMSETCGPHTMSFPPNTVKHGSVGTVRARSGIQTKVLKRPHMEVGGSVCGHCHTREYHKDASPSPPAPDVVDSVSNDTTSSQTVDKEGEVNVHMEYGVMDLSLSSPRSSGEHERKQGMNAHNKNKSDDNNSDSNGNINNRNNNSNVNDDGSTTKNGEHIGEIAFKGRHVFLGYYRDVDKTRAAFTSDGWLLSGDLGHIDEDGFIYITGRKKEVLITSIGVNVCPVPIEEAIKERCALVSNAVVIGEGRSALAVLLTVKQGVDGCGRPTHMLSEDCRAALSDISPYISTVAEAIADQDVHDHIQACIESVNEHAFASQKIVRYKILDEDFTIDNGMLGHTMKLKRKTVKKVFAKDIEAMYKR